MATYVKGSAVANAERYDLLEKNSNGTYTTLVNDAMEINFEVSALGLSSGSHTLVVIAQADGYTDSAYSNEVVYEVSGGSSGGSGDSSSSGDSGSSIVLELTKSAYWWNMSTNPAGNTNMVTTAYTSQSNQKYFWCTQKFTKDTLPVGSVITLASGWQYRAEWWNANNDPVASQSERGPVISTAGSVTVDDDWWGSMTTRAFNIYINTSTDISGYTEDQINAAFKITKGG